MVLTGSPSQSWRMPNTPSGGCTDRLAANPRLKDPPPCPRIIERISSCAVVIELVPPPYGIGKGYTPTNPDIVLTRQEWGKGFDDPGNTLRGKHNIHAYTRDDTACCALAIAYKNRAAEVLPEDFVIFTVIHDCVKRQREPIDIPNLHACPNNICICAWLWLPKNSGARNFYMTPFVCHVTGANMDASPNDYDYAIPPRSCLDPKLCK